MVVPVACAVDLKRKRQVMRSVMQLVAGLALVVDRESVVGQK